MPLPGLSLPFPALRPADKPPAPVPVVSFELGAAGGSWWLGGWAPNVAKLVKGLEGSLAAGGAATLGFAAPKTKAGARAPVETAAVTAAAAAAGVAAAVVAGAAVEPAEKVNGVAAGTGAADPAPNTYAGPGACWVTGGAVAVVGADAGVDPKVKPDTETAAGAGAGAGAGAEAGAATAAAPVAPKTKAAPGAGDGAGEGVGAGDGAIAP